ncbi:Hca operon transcriptional activator [Actinomadura rubteroloni]|uniref:Hca operon transcriptional activator n=1 Tax=Actinomadura rubteroloni TaxID=1926885 RepID=A0A2P4UD22_9ACTN|nr:LysR family transcriptional regulator [Actinomadura rubteroloni]POM22944.1 Hca operon transcriptional activator [Actinomadura rubteroloni]
MVEIRELRYFVAVAEELHFGRAAERLGIAQPPLSRAVQKLERQVGVPLLERTSRRVALTGAGAVFLRESRAVLDAADAAVRRARRAAAPGLVLVMKPGGDGGGLLRDVLDAYRAQPGAVPVDVRFSFGERAEMLRDGRADAALLHRPRNDLTGLAWEELLVERQVVLLPPGHRLAGRAAVRLDDLRGEPAPRYPGSPGDATGPEVTETGHLSQLVALGRAVAVVPESLQDQLRRDLVAVPVTDAPPTTLVLAWAEGARSPELAAFVRCAAEVAAAS